MRVIPYEEKYRDDMLFVVLQAKDALGRVPTVNPDLLDIPASYTDRGDLFLLAVNDNGRVCGCVGFSREPGTDEAFLHRFYVKPSLQRQGIGTLLLGRAEDEMRARGITAAKVHLGTPPEQWAASYAFYPKHGYATYAPRYMKKDL